MAITLKKAKKIQKRCLKVGIEACAKEEGKKVKTIERYVQLAQRGVEKQNKQMKRFIIEQAEREIHQPVIMQDEPIREVNRLNGYIHDIAPSQRSDDHNRILNIGDLHEPFSYKQYLSHCIAIKEKYGCNRTIFMGDIIDNHYSSYHETDADGMGGQDELNLAIERLKPWYEAFPEADVLIGNHDRMVMRKAQSSSIPTRWIKEYKEVLGVPNWNFTDRVVYDDVQYIHGEGGTARSRAKKDLMSTVQGHLHTQCYVEWVIGAGLKIFAMQVGCGIDAESYAMGYAKNFGKPAIACGVVLNGKVAINEVLSTRGGSS